MSVRKIIHVDMDAFYASVEQRDDPSLRGRPVVVGGDPRSRGVVCAASYEARRYGIRSALPSAQAVRLCPEVVFLRPDFDRYREASSGMHAIFADYADAIEPLSLDEAYLDVSTDRAGLGSATTTARRIRRRVRSELRLTVSAGVAPNKFVAKIASDYDKPDGLCVVPPARVVEFLRPLPIRRVPGIGPKGEQRLAVHGLERIGDLMDLRDGDFERLFGSRADWFRGVARGEDPRPVAPAGRRKQVSIEDTFSADLEDPASCRERLLDLCDRLWERVVAKERFGRTLTVKVRYGDFTQVTRSGSRSDPIEDLAEARSLALGLLSRTEAGDRPVRLLGVGVANFDPGEGRQLRLF